MTDQASDDTGTPDKPGVRYLNPAQDLIDELSAALAEAKGMPIKEANTYVEPVVRYLQQQYNGDKMYIPTTHLRRDVSEAIDAIRNRMPMKQVLSEFGISRRSYYRLLSQI